MSELVLAANVAGPAQWSSGPLEVDLVPDEDLVIRHGLGRAVGFSVVWADGPATYWAVPTEEPYETIALRASVAVTARVCLI